ncbi:hypothetical protein ACWDMZ_22540, partial [Streptomyces sp. NPDC000994]
THALGGLLYILEQEGLVFPEVRGAQGSGTRQVLDAALGGLARPLIELSSTTADKASAVSGTGPAVLRVRRHGKRRPSRAWRPPGGLGGAGRCRRLRGPCRCETGGRRTGRPGPRRCRAAAPQRPSRRPRRPRHRR